MNRRRSSPISHRRGTNRQTHSPIARCRKSEVAGQAGRLVAEAYQQFRQIPDAPADIHTKADAASQELILGYLKKTFPGDALCAEEETASIVGVPPLPANQCWVCK